MKTFELVLVKTVRKNKIYWVKHGTRKIGIFIFPLKIFIGREDPWLDEKIQKLPRYLKRHVIKIVDSW